jgi:hypothetical protein
MEHPYSLQIRRLQALQSERSLTHVLPEDFVIALGIGKGDFLKCPVDSNRIVIEKVTP